MCRAVSRRRLMCVILDTNNVPVSARLTPDGEPARRLEILERQVGQVGW